MIIELLELGVVGFCNIDEVLSVRAVYGAWVCFALSIPQMIPVGSRKRQLQIPMFLFRSKALEVLELFYISAANVLYLSRADRALRRFVPLLHECGNVGNILAEDFWFGVLDLLNPFQPRPEFAPEH